MRSMLNLKISNTQPWIKRHTNCGKDKRKSCTWILDHQKTSVVITPSLAKSETVMHGTQLQQTLFFSNWFYDAYDNITSSDERKIYIHC